jgi:MFS transporter, putative metabolite:H+ symporter
MLDLLERQQKLTGNQRRIVFAAILGDGLEFFDYFVIGFVLAFIVGPWKLTFGQFAVIFLSSGIGAMIGAYVWGWAADRIGRRKVFIATVLNFAIASGILALTPEGSWIFLSIFRFFVGVGVGGLYCVDLPLVQEFMPTAKRGRIGGIVTAAIPLGTGLGAVLGAFLAPAVGWRGLFVVGLLPAALTLLIRAWVPESPRWLMRMGRFEEARKSLAWALEMDPKDIELTTVRGEPQKAAWSELFKHPRSLAVSWLGNLGTQTGIYGLTLWLPTLFVQILGISPPQASRLMISVTLGGFVGRLSFSYLSDAIGRRASGGLLGLGAAVMLVLTAYLHDAFLGTISMFWLLTVVTYFFADGGFAIVGPYAAEVWPAGLRTSGMGSAYGFGGLGKIIGPLGLALIAGSSNIVTPQASVAAIGPAFIYLAAWYLLAGIVYYFFGIETKGRSIEYIDEELARPIGPRPATAT